MDNFKISLPDTQTVAVGEVLEIATGPKGRTFECEIIASEPVYLVFDEGGHMENAKVVGTGSHFKCAIGLNHVGYIAVDGPAHAHVSIVTKTRTQHIPRDNTRESVTTIEPRGSRSSEFDRMAYMMQRNQRRMMDQLQAVVSELNETKREKAKSDAGRLQEGGAALDKDAPKPTAQESKPKATGADTKADPDPSGS